jgi:transcriptional regulator with XRE-family HTH domain
MARPKSLSRQLRLLRQERGLRVADVADRLGVTTACVYHWETGRSRPRSGNLSALCKILRVPLREAESMV